jgi:hypothetical protein
MNELPVGATGPNTATDRQTTAAFERAAGDRHHPVPQATYFSDLGRLADLSANFERQRQSRRLILHARDCRRLETSAKGLGG